MKKLFVIIVLSFTLLFSCKKEVYEVNTNFAGQWIGKDGTYNYEFYIDESSHGTFKIFKNESLDSEHTGVLRKEGEKLVMNRLNTFIVETEPYQLDTGITFVLHDYEYPVTWSMKVKTPRSWGGSEITYYK